MGQNYEQEVSVPPGPITESTLQDVFERFHRQHEEFYGYSIPREIMELIHFNVSLIGEVPKMRLPKWDSQSIDGPGRADSREVYFEGPGSVKCPVYLREALAAGAVIHGPAVIDDVDSTVVLPVDKRLSITDLGLMIIE